MNTKNNCLFFTNHLLFSSKRVTRMQNPIETSVNCSDTKESKTTGEPQFLNSISQILKVHFCNLPIGGVNTCFIVVFCTFHTLTYNSVFISAAFNSPKKSARILQVEEPFQLFAAQPESDSVVPIQRILNPGFDPVSSALQTQCKIQNPKQVSSLFERPEKI